MTMAGAKRSPRLRRRAAWSLVERRRGKKWRRKGLISFLRRETSKELMFWAVRNRSQSFVGTKGRSVCLKQDCGGGFLRASLSSSALVSFRIGFCAGLPAFAFFEAFFAISISRFRNKTLTPTLSRSTGRGSRRRFAYSLQNDQQILGLHRRAG